MRVEVCKIDLTTVDVQTLQRLAPLFMYAKAAPMGGLCSEKTPLGPGK